MPTISSEEMVTSVRNETLPFQGVTGNEKSR